jgi:hypothetical protein
VAGLQELRTISLPKEDQEVRIWRGFGLGNLEGVILSEHAGTWSAKHVVADDSLRPTGATVTELPEPRHGWPQMKADMSSALLNSFSASCGEEAQVDGIGYVIEVNKDGIYRTARFPDSSHTCLQSVTVKQLAVEIAREFDDGKAKCETAEWLPCLSTR